MRSTRPSWGHHTICPKSYAKLKIAVISYAFTNCRLCMDPREDGFRPNFPFKSLFQNHGQRQLSYEKDGVPIQLMAKPLLPYDFGQIVW